MSATILSARGLSFSYGRNRVLSDVDLQIPSGIIVGLVGPNGVGKSTLLRCLLGLLPGGGEITLFGKPLSTLHRIEVARSAAFVPQSFQSEFAFSVREIVAMGRVPHLGRFQPERDTDRSAIDAALSATGLSALRDRRVSEISGGERQRVAIARALAQESPLLVLDEPNANLDPHHAYSAMEVVRQHVDTNAETHGAIAALHDLSLAAKFCDRILVLRDGSIGYDGPPEDVFTEAILASVFQVDAEIYRDRNHDLQIGIVGATK